MTAEPYTVSLVSRLAIDMPKNLPKAYYRSKLFIVPYTTNPLIAAAGPLFSLLERLCISQALPSVNSIRYNIEHELNAFHSKLNASNYSSELTAIAHYLLTATIDEILGKSYLRIYGENAEFKAFTPLTQDSSKPQSRFFEITCFIKERPNQYLDLIELSYYCLITGFEGEQHLKADGRQHLDNLIEELYLLIQKHRVHKPYKLNNTWNSPKILPKKKNTFLISGLLALGVFLSSCWLSHLFLERKANAVLSSHFQHSTLDK